MAKIIATGVPVLHKEFGEIRITVEGDEVNIRNVTTEIRKGDDWVEEPIIEDVLDADMKDGPRYPLCAEPFTMRCALFVLFEWFGEAESCWVEEPKHVKLEGEIEPMESEPGVVY